MSDLSRTAQAVLDAANSAFDAAGTTSQGIAAALRAAADQVVPEEPWPVSMMGPVYVAEAKQRRRLRSQLLTIAAELEQEANH